MTERKLAHAQFSYQPNVNPIYSIPNSAYPSTRPNSELPYHDMVRQCRFFYENDTIAGTVINRMVDIASTPLRNRHRKSTAEVRAYFDGIARIISPLLKVIPLSYMLDGMAIPEYRTTRIMGSRLDYRLGRTRYTIPKTVWIRDSANIVLKKSPLGERVVFIKITGEDKNFIRNKGKPDREVEYQELERLYPEYVMAVMKNQDTFRLETARPIYRKLTTYNDYPLPFLKNSLDALAHRRRLKQMDRITSDRVINALRQISVGSDEFPADDDDIEAAKRAIESQTNQETLLNVYTNHTIRIQWIIPEMSNLLDDSKYDEANSDVFMGMGFPRLWAVGENAKSNTSDNKLASVGPLSTLQDMRNDMLVWIRLLYEDLANDNGFTTYPDPYLAPINTADAQDLLQYASTFVDNKTISRDTVAQIYNTTYLDEQEQMKLEVPLEMEQTNDVSRTESNPADQGTIQE